MVWRKFSLPFVFPSHFSHFRGFDDAFAASRRPHSSQSETESMSPRLVHVVSACQLRAKHSPVTDTMAPSLLPSGTATWDSVDRHGPCGRYLVEWRFGSEEYFHGWAGWRCNSFPDASSPICVSMKL
jgi:hypothetical protein